MTTDKLSAAHEAQILRLIADAARGFPYDRFSAALTDEAARREGVENAPKCPQCSAAGYCTGKCNLIPAPPADERAQLERERDDAVNIGHAFARDAESATARAGAAEARIAELERERDAARSRADRRFEEYVKQGEELRAANARAEAAEARERGLREAAKAYRQAEQDYVFMAERPDEEYVPADVHLARMHMHRAAGALDAALAQKEPSNG